MPSAQGTKELGSRSSGSQPYAFSNPSATREKTASTCDGTTGPAGGKEPSPSTKGRSWTLPRRSLPSCRRSPTILPQTTGCLPTSLSRRQDEFRFCAGRAWTCFRRSAVEHSPQLSLLPRTAIGTTTPEPMPWNWRCSASMKSPSRTFAKRWSAVRSRTNGRRISEKVFREHLRQGDSCL